MKRIGMLGALLLTTLGLLLGLGAPAQATYTKTTAELIAAGNEVIEDGHICEVTGSGYNKVFITGGNAQLEKLAKVPGNMSKRFVATGDKSIYTTNTTEGTNIWTNGCNTVVENPVAPELIPPACVDGASIPAKLGALPLQKFGIEFVSQTDRGSIGNPFLVTFKTLPGLTFADGNSTMTVSVEVPDVACTPPAPALKEATPITPQLVCPVYKENLTADISIPGATRVSGQEIPKLWESEGVIYDVQARSVTATPKEGFEFAEGIQTVWTFDPESYFDEECVEDETPVEDVPVKNDPPTTPAPVAPVTPVAPETAKPVTPAAPAAEVAKPVIPVATATPVATEKATAEAAPEGQLAQTGTNGVGILWAGILLIAGAVLLLGARRYKNN